MQGLWKGVLPSLVMVSNPTVQYVLYEWMLARLAELKRNACAPSHRWARRWAILALVALYPQKISV